MGQQTTAAEKLRSLESERDAHLKNADEHAAKSTAASASLSEIKRSREDRIHLEKSLAGDAAAKRKDDKWDQDEAALEREIRRRDGLAADSRAKAAELANPIGSAAFAAVIDMTGRETASVRNFAEDVGPQLAGLNDFADQVQARVTAHCALLQSLPEPAPLQLAPFINALPRLFGRAILAEIGGSLRRTNLPIDVPANLKGCTFASVIGDFFSELHRALENLAATRYGADSRRTRYRVVGHISGGARGLNLRNGDEISLVTDAEETQKLLALGALENISAGSVAGGSR